MIGCKEHDPEASSGKGLSWAAIVGENWAVEDPHGELPGPGASVHQPSDPSQCGMLSRGQRNLKLSQSMRDPGTFLVLSRVEEVEVGASREALWPAWGLDQIPGVILLAPHTLNAEVIPGGAPPHIHYFAPCSRNS